MVTNVYVKFNYDRLHIDKGLGWRERATTSVSYTHLTLPTNREV